MATTTGVNPVEENNLEVLVRRMLVLAVIIKDGGKPVFKPINLYDKPHAQYPLSEFFMLVRDSFLQLPIGHPLQEKYTIEEVSRALRTLSEYERSYALIEPGYFPKVDAA